MHASVCTYVLPRPPVGDANLDGIAARAVGGDELAWNALVARFDDTVWATTRAHRLSADDAADVAQTTWMRLVEHIGAIEEPGCIGGWLKTTARRECLTTIRRVARAAPSMDDLPDLPGDTPHPGQRLMLQQDSMTINRALAHLDSRDRALLGMLCGEPTPSYTEISEALGVPIGSIGPTRARALRRLRAEIAAIAEQPDMLLAEIH